MALNGYLLGTLCGAGITGNVLTLVVLQRDNDNKNPTNWLLQAHAAFDSLYLFARLLARGFHCLHDVTVTLVPTPTVTKTLLSGVSLQRSSPRKPSPITTGRLCSSR